MANPKSLLDFVGPFTEHGDELNFECCPVCGSTGKNTYVNTKTGKWYCFARNHGAGGKIELRHDAVTERNNIIQMIKEFTSDSDTNNSWPEKVLPWCGPVTDTARHYLFRRRIEHEHIAEYGLTAMLAMPRVVVPFFGDYGQIIHWVARSYISNILPKYLAAPGPAPLYVLPTWSKVNKLILVEGVFDAMRVHIATNKPVAALGGKALSAANFSSLRTLVRDEITVMLDGDATGAALALLTKLKDEWRTGIVLLDTGVDPADLTDKQLKGVLTHENEGS